MTWRSKGWKEAVHEMLSFASDLGIGKCVQLIERDGSFALPQIQIAGLIAISGSDQSHKLVQSHCKLLFSTSVPLEQHEISHFNAIRLWFDRDFEAAMQKWYSIIVLDPLDILAIKFLQTSCILLGETKRLYSLFAQILPIWTDLRPPWLSFVKGMAAFAFEESREFDVAEVLAREALLSHSDDIWALHALAHILFEQERNEEGILLVESTEEGWKDQNGLTCHVYWHKALFHLELSQFDKVIEILDHVIFPAIRKSCGFPLDLADAISLLWRLDVVGIDVGDRWKCVTPFIEKQWDTQVYLYNIAHFMLSLLHSSGQVDPNEFVKLYTTRTDLRHAEFCGKLLQALLHWKDCSAFNELFEIRHDFWKIGGSNAQRDVFEITLIETAVREHKEDLRLLLNERKRRKGHDLYASFVSETGDLPDSE